MKRCRYVIHNLPGDHTARFSDPDAALRYARQESQCGGYTEVYAPDGLIGQFQNGVATEEFAHLDRPA